MKIRRYLRSARHLQKKTSAAGQRNHAGDPGRQPQATMNIFEVQGNWNIAKGKLKQKFAQLTDDDLRFMEGKEDELVGLIQKRTGQARETVERAISQCYTSKQLNECNEEGKT